jgi:hypothetical protein
MKRESHEEGEPKVGLRVRILEEICVEDTRTIYPKTRRPNAKD